MVILIVAGIWLFNGRDGGGKGAVADLPTQTAPALANLPATETPKPEAATPTGAPPTATATLEPSPTATQGTPTLPPTPTVPPGIPFVRINAITTNDQGMYVVDYETFEYTEKLPGVHVHFFFDNVPQEQAGNPGNGPWYLYGGPRPFDKFRLTDRPEESAQMCALVANANHSIQLNSGNCAPLPDVPAAIALQDMPCLAGAAGLGYLPGRSLVECGNPGQAG